MHVCVICNISHIIMYWDGKGKFDQMLNNIRPIAEFFLWSKLIIIKFYKMKIS